MKAFISGASTGLGFSMAEVLARKGYSLILTSKDRERLENACGKLRVHGNPVTGYTADLTKEGEIEELFNKIAREDIMPDVYINNAGSGFYGQFREMDITTASGIIRLNITAVTRAMRYELGLLGSHGHIVNIASTAAFQPGAYSAVYYATKSYVYNLTRAVQRENRERGLKITAACPGPTSTPFHEKAGIGGAKEGYAMDPLKTADIIIKAMEKGRKVIIPGFRNKVLVYGSRILPRTLIEYIIGRFNRRRLEI